MQNQRQAIDEALRHHRWQSLVSDVKGGWWVVALLTTLVLGASYWIASPRHIVGTAVGVAVGAHLDGSELGRDPLRVTVQLASGDLVAVNIPPTVPYRANVVMELRVIGRDWWPKTLTYQFVRYSETPANPDHGNARGY